MDLKRYALVVEYNGANTVGFQRQTRREQPGSIRKLAPKKWLTQSVQEELESKLSLILNEPICIDAAGRTDAGVHATGQVIAFNTGKQRSPEELLRSSNAVLAPWIRVRRVVLVGPDFKPRYQALRRVYHYYILPEQGRGEDPFWEKMAWILPGRLDVAAMQEAADKLLGEHDFRAYSRGEEPGKNTRRTLHRLLFKLPQGRFEELQPGPVGRLGPLLCLEVEANAFLQRMVRRLAANLVKVGLGEWDIERPYRILQSGDPSQGAPPAPAAGVYLVEADYPELQSTSLNFPTALPTDEGLS